MTISILHIISSLEVGGAEKLLIDLLNANKLNAENTDITVVVMNDKVDEEFKKELLNTKYKVYFFNRQEGYKHPKYLFMLLDIIKQNNIDIIHTHNPGAKFWSVLCKLIKPRIKTVYTIHDTNIIQEMTGMERFIQKVFIDMNITISKTVLDECHQYGVNKVSQIYNGICISNFISSKNKDDNPTFNIINIARLTYYKKGQDILIKALKICKDKEMNFTCNFVGGSYDYDKESLGYLKGLVEELKLEKNVNFLGNRGDIPDLLSQSDLFILPSRYEGLGLVVLEAMASKVPVITSNIDGPAELITHDKNGFLFESENPSDLAEKILYLYNNKEKMQELAQNAYEYVQDFDISVMCRKYYELYKEL